MHLSDETVTPPPTPAAPGADSVEAANFRVALTDVDTRMALSVPVPAIIPLDLGNAIH